MNITRLDGQITAASGSNDESEDFSAIGIEARENITLGDMGATEALPPRTNGMDAYGLFAGEEGGYQTHSNITIGNVGGAIRAEAMAGTARGARSTGSLSVGNVSGFISASSTGAAEAYGLLAEFSDHRHYQRNRQRGNCRQHGGGPDGRSRHHDDHRFHRRH